MATKRDYYDVLGVGRNASAEEIKKAYRRLAMKYHPDRNAEDGASDRFKEATEAYEILNDTDKRSRYDQFGHAGVDGNFAGGMGGFEGFGGGFPFGDIFETFFGAGGTNGRRRGPQRGTDLRYDLTIEFEEAVFGRERELEVPRMEVCHVCSGSGAEPGTQPVACTRCNGRGEIRRVQQSILGQFVNVTVCPTCHGEGTIVNSPCKNCHGQGRERVTRRIRVTIPAGIDDGSQIRLTGEGEPGTNNGPRGNLYVVVAVKPHRYFRREANDIVIDLPINVTQAVLGAEVEVPTVDGPTGLKIPSGVQPGRVLRMKGKGVPHLRDQGRGDQLVRVSVVVPTNLTDKQKKLFKELGDTFNGEVTPKENKGFFDKVKDAFGV
ncbi:MAG TPA: molecular chaperone DnaJ [Chloroflexota bacterium]